MPLLDHRTALQELCPISGLALASAGYGRAGAGARTERPCDGGPGWKRTRAFGTVQRAEANSALLQSALGSQTMRVEDVLSFPRCEFRTQLLPPNQPPCPGRQPHTAAWFPPSSGRIPPNPVPWVSHHTWGAACLVWRTGGNSLVLGALSSRPPTTASEPDIDRPARPGLRVHSKYGSPLTT